MELSTVVPPYIHWSSGEPGDAYPGNESFGIFRNQIPKFVWKRAMRAITRSLNDCLRHGWQGTYDDGTSWFPTLRESDEIMALVGYLPFQGTLCEPQILLGFPATDHPGPIDKLVGHTDEEPEWAQGRKYSKIAGVPLTPWTPANGSPLFQASEEDWYVMTPLVPGDVLWFNPDVVHTAGTNLSPDIRYGVYFRWLEEKSSWRP